MAQRVSQIDFSASSKGDVSLEVPRGFLVVFLMTKSESCFVFFFIKNLTVTYVKIARCVHDWYFWALDN